MPFLPNLVLTSECCFAALYLLKTRILYCVRYMTVTDFHRSLRNPHSQPLRRTDFYRYTLGNLKKKPNFLNYPLAVRYCCCFFLTPEGINWVSKSCNVLTSQVLCDRELWYLHYTKLSIYNNFKFYLALNYSFFFLTLLRGKCLPLWEMGHWSHPP